MDKPALQNRRMEQNRDLVDEITSIRSEGWSVWQSCRALLPRTLSSIVAHGLTGGCIRSLQAPFTYSDLTQWIIPGLAALGIPMALTPFAGMEPDAVEQLQQRIATGGPMPVFTFDATPIYNDPASDLSSIDAALDAADIDIETDVKGMDTIARNAKVSREELLVSIIMEAKICLTLADMHGQKRTMALSDLQSNSFYMTAAATPGKRSTVTVSVREAVRRMAAFASAEPDRLMTAGAEDRAIRELAAEFLYKISGKRRDRMANRWRWAAVRFADAANPDDIMTAVGWIVEAVCIDLQLPQVVTDALLTPDEEPLSDVKRRELIYLARAGTRDLRVLAARRLRSEIEHSDARRTLEQLRADPDIWVRA